MRGLPSGCEIEEDESKATCAAQVGALSDKQWSAGFQFQAEADKATKHTCTRRMLMPACSRQAPECFRALLAILIKTVLPGLQPHNARTRSAQARGMHARADRQAIAPHVLRPPPNAQRSPGLPDLERAPRTAISGTNRHHPSLTARHNMPMK